MRNRTPTVALVLVAVLVLAACPGMTPDRVTLNSVQTIRESAISTMKVIGALYQQDRTFDQAGKVISVNVPNPIVSEAGHAKAVELYNRIQAGCKAVVASLEMVTTVQQGADLTKPLQDLVDQLAALLRQFQTGGGS